MAPWLISLVAAISIILCFFLWFREVKRVMRENKSTVESAGAQLAVSRVKALRTRDDPESAAVLERSCKIYRQAVENYNLSLRKPWYWLPARLLGFRPID